MVRSCFTTDGKHGGTGSRHTRHDQESVRVAIQCRQAPPAEMSRDWGIPPKTVANSRKRKPFARLEAGPRAPRSIVLTEAEAAWPGMFLRHARRCLTRRPRVVTSAATTTGAAPLAVHAAAGRSGRICGRRADD